VTGYKQEAPSHHLGNAALEDRPVVRQERRLHKAEIAADGSVHEFLRQGAEAVLDKSQDQRDSPDGLPSFQTNLLVRLGVRPAGGLGDLAVQDISSQDATVKSGDVEMDRLGTQVFYNWSQSLEANINETFKRLLVESRMEEDLNAVEVAIYADHFFEYMTYLAKTTNITAANMEQKAASWQKLMRVAMEAAKPVQTQKLVDSLNLKPGLTWKAAVSQDLYSLTWLEAILLAGVYEHKNVIDIARDSGPLNFEAQRLLGSSYLDGASTEFDARLRWPHCADVFSHIRDQGQCGSSWAVAASAVADARLCIATAGRFSGISAKVSAGYVASCQGGTTGNGCEGGSLLAAFNFLGRIGAPTGGHTDDTSTCVPYLASGGAMSHFSGQAATPPCPNECYNRHYQRSLQEDIFKMSGAVRVTMDVEKAKAVIQMHGPIAVSLYVFRDFYSYRSGIYKPSIYEFAGAHSMMAIGFGQDYILMANSWGRSWGNGGLVKVSVHTPMMFYLLGDISTEDEPLPVPNGPRHAYDLNMTSPGAVTTPSSTTRTPIGDLCAWVETLACHPDGMKSGGGKDCQSNISPGVAGYCDCNGNGAKDVQEPGYDCDSSPGNCESACAIAVQGVADTTSSMSSATPTSSQFVVGHATTTQVVAGHSPASTTTEIISSIATSPPASSEPGGATTTIGAAPGQAATTTAKAAGAVIKAAEAAPASSTPTPQLISSTPAATSATHTATEGTTMTSSIAGASSEQTEEALASIPSTTTTSTIASLTSSKTSTTTTSTITSLTSSTSTGNSTTSTFTTVTTTTTTTANFAKYMVAPAGGYAHADEYEMVQNDTLSQCKSDRDIRSAGMCHAASIELSLAWGGVVDEPVLQPYCYLDNKTQMMHYNLAPPGVHTSQVIGASRTSYAVCIAAQKPLETYMPLGRGFCQDSNGTDPPREATIPAPQIDACEAQCSEEPSCNAFDNQSGVCHFYCSDDIAKASGFASGAEFGCWKKQQVHCGLVGNNDGEEVLAHLHGPPSRSIATSPCQCKLHCHELARAKAWVFNSEAKHCKCLRRLGSWSPSTHHFSGTIGQHMVIVERESEPVDDRPDLVVTPTNDTNHSAGEMSTTQPAGRKQKALRKGKSKRGFTTAAHRSLCRKGDEIQSARLCKKAAQTFGVFAGAVELDRTRPGCYVDDAGVVRFNKHAYGTNFTEYTSLCKAPLPDSPSLSSRTGDESVLGFEVAGNGRLCTPRHRILTAEMCEVAASSMPSNWSTSNYSEIIYIGEVESAAARPDCFMHGNGSVVFNVGKPNFDSKAGLDGHSLCMKDAAIHYTILGAGDCMDESGTLAPTDYASSDVSECEALCTNSATCRGYANKTSGCHLVNDMDVVSANADIGSGYCHKKIPQDCGAHGHQKGAQLEDMLETSNACSCHLACSSRGAECVGYTYFHMFKQCQLLTSLDGLSDDCEGDCSYGVMATSNVSLIEAGPDPFDDEPASFMEVDELDTLEATSTAQPSSRPVRLQVVSGECRQQEDCVSSPHWPNAYGANGSCVIEVQGSNEWPDDDGHEFLIQDVMAPPDHVGLGGDLMLLNRFRRRVHKDSTATTLLLEVQHFATERGYDNLVVNGLPYSGVIGPHGVKASGTIHWSSDGSVHGRGFRICTNRKPDVPAVHVQPSDWRPPHTITDDMYQAKVWAVVPGPRGWPDCRVDSDYCISSPMYPNPYSAYSQCKIMIAEDASVRIKVHDFATEAFFDTLIVNQQRYSGRDSPDGVKASGMIIWSSDGSVAETGWKFCPESVWRDAGVDSSGHIQNYNTSDERETIEVHGVGEFEKGNSSHDNISEHNAHQEDGSHSAESGQTVRGFKMTMFIIPSLLSSILALLPM